MISLKNLSVGYDNESVLSDVSLDFPKGQITILLGPNGCGKTTLLKTCLGLYQKIDGEILFDEKPISNYTSSEIAQKAAYMAQSRIIPNISVKKMVLHGRFPYLSYPRHYRKEDYEAADNALKQADAYDLENRQMQELSGGQRQKVYLAMALAQDTETIFMDEPTTYLDVRHQLEVMETAKTLANQGKAVVMVLHDLGLSMIYGDRLAVFSQGKLCKYGNPEEVFSSGILDEVFDVYVRRVYTEDGWIYYCKSNKK